jgi:SAM-dependent methyltransferase
MINTIIQQLKEVGYEKAIGVNVDFTEKSLSKMKTDFLDKSDNLHGVQGDISEMPIKENSVDIGISRYMLQYFGKEKQMQVLENMLATLKPNSKLIVQFPIASKTTKQAQLINEFYNTIDSLVTGKSIDETTENRYLPSLEDIKMLANKLVIKCSANFVEDFKFPISAESYFDRFNITSDEQKKKILEVFNSPDFRQRASKLGGMSFVEENGIMYVKTPDAKIVFEK